MQTRLQTTLHSPRHTQCPLYLDILETILYEHRLDTHTLAQCALVSRTMLQLTRKVLYRSVSFDQSENPYAFDQQRLLRTSLADNTHLCNYIHNLRLPLSDDPLLARVMKQLTKIESLHVIGDGPGVGEVSRLAEQQHYHHSSAGSSRRNGLRRLFGLASLRKVKLEGSFPFSVIDFSAFSQLKDLEVSSVWGLGFDSPEERQQRDDSDSLSSPSHESNTLPAIPPSRASGTRFRLDRLSLKAKTLGPLCQLFSNHGGPFIRVQDSSDVDVSHLRELHLDICNPEDSDAIWSALRQCSHSLEVLSIRQVWNDSQSLTFSDSGLGFSNLTTLVLGIPAFSPMDNPFQPLLRLLSNRATAHAVNQCSRFPSLRTLKVIFDLWACAGSNTPWRTICGYRGWAELDDALRLAFDDEGAQPSITFEIQSSFRYKQYDGQEAVREPAGLVLLLLNEMPFLRHNSKFTIL